MDLHLHVIHSNLDVWAICLGIYLLHHAKMFLEIYVVIIFYQIVFRILVVSPKPMLFVLIICFIRPYRKEIYRSASWCLLGWSNHEYFKFWYTSKIFCGYSSGKLYSLRLCKVNYRRIFDALLYPDMSIAKAFEMAECYYFFFSCFQKLYL